MELSMGDDGVCQDVGELVCGRGKGCVGYRRELIIK